MPSNAGLNVKKLNRSRLNKKKDIQVLSHTKLTSTEFSASQYSKRTNKKLINNNRKSRLGVLQIKFKFNKKLNRELAVKTTSPKTSFPPDQGDPLEGYLHSKGDSISTILKGGLDQSANSQGVAERTSYLLPSDSQLNKPQVNIQRDKQSIISKVSIEDPVTLKGTNSGENSLLIGGDLVITKVESLAHKSDTSRDSQSVEQPKVTIKQISYKCDSLQQHIRRCSCTSPRLHTYILTKHRCIGQCLLVQESDTALMFSQNTTGSNRNRSRKSSNPQKLSSVKQKRSFIKEVMDASESPIPNKTIGDRFILPAKTSATTNPVQKMAFDGKNSDWKSLLTSKLDKKMTVVHSLPTTYNRSKSSADRKTSSNKLKNKLKTILEEIEPKETQVDEQPQFDKNKKPKTVKKGQQKIKSKCTTGKVVLNLKPKDSLAEICTNQKPSMKDIFGDVDIKEEPLDLDCNDMTIEEFRHSVDQGKHSKQHVLKSTRVKKKRNIFKGESKGLFEQLIKEEDDDHSYDSDHSLGALEIDEDKVLFPLELEESNPVIKQDILSPRKILILAQVLPTIDVNETNKVNVKCQYCNFEAADSEMLKEHLENHQKDGLILCLFCQKSFGDRTSMKRHMRTHTGEKPYKCLVCFKQFSLPGNFKKHRDIHENLRTQPCTVCGKTFRRKEHLKYHMRTHTGERPFICKICNAAFTARYSLQIHMNIHLGRKPYKCQFCTKAFSDKSTMRKHVRVHTGEKPFLCIQCGRSFGESGTLAAHMATHRSDRPHKCDKCDLTFKTSGGRRQHERVHTGQKQYACSHCDMKFLQKYNMAMHERIHTGEKPYTCDDCGKHFRSRSCMAKHVVVHGGDEERHHCCHLCERKFFRKAHLQRHVEMHEGVKHYECDRCDKRFATLATFKKHREVFHTEGARRFPCEHCGRVFKRQIYVTSHECKQRSESTAEPLALKQEDVADDIEDDIEDDFDEDESYNEGESDGSSLDIKEEQIGMEEDKELSQSMI